MKKFGKGYWKTFEEGIEREWVITNGLGGYAGSSIIGANTRKHHGLLIASLHAPVKRHLILSKINEKVTVASREYSLETNQKPGWKEEGQKYLQRFIYDETVHFCYQVEDVFITKTVAFEHGKNTIAIGYELVNGSQTTRVCLTPLFNFRDHSERSERSQLQFETNKENGLITLVPKANEEVKIQFFVNEGILSPREEVYFEEMEYQTEINTGMTAIDNHYMPYDITISLKPHETKKVSVICTIEEEFEQDAFVTIQKFTNRMKSVVAQAGYEDEFAKDLVQAADQFIVDRESTGNKTILAGLPWFTDWGRDTMIAMQGLTLVTKRYEDAKGILRSFAQYVKKGLVPNMFPDEDCEPLYNTVDASLWYFHAVDQFLKYTGDKEAVKFIREEIYDTLEEIVKAYKEGTDFSIKMDSDYLIHAGGGFDQVTWMDVRVGEWVVTPRHGKPVEINALWYNAIKVMEKLAMKVMRPFEEYTELAEHIKESFCKKFWNEKKNCLYDVVNDNGNDDKIRPNQIYAVSLPYTMLPREKEKAVVDTVISQLYATYGLRSLSFLDEEYKGIYYGKLHDRDAAYHQGTCWAFPLGGLITAYTKVNDYSEESIAYAKRMLMPLEDHLRDGCIGSIAEVFDGDAPNISRGCYAQAWSVGEILRAYVEDILLKGKEEKKPEVKQEEQKVSKASTASLLIRGEEEEDYKEIDNVLRSAFGGMNTETPEWESVNKLRTESEYVKELSLVAELDAKIVGHCMLSKCSIKDNSGLLLAPLSVAKEYQNSGIGSALVKESIRLAKELGYSWIAVVGGGYYERFDFVKAAENEITLEGKENASLYLLELVEDGLKEVTGELKISKVF